MSFNDSLLEAKGFENHYLVTTLGELNKASFRGRLPAIGRKRVGAIDYIMQQSVMWLERHLKEIDNASMSLVSWSCMGVAGEGKKAKQTISLSLESELKAIMGLASESETLCSIGFLEYPQFIEYIPKGEQLLTTEDEDEEIAEWVEHLSQHPLYVLAKELVDRTRIEQKFTFLGCDNRLTPSRWYFSWQEKAEAPMQHIYIHINNDQLMEEIEMVME